MAANPPTAAPANLNPTSGSADASAAVTAAAAPASPPVMPPVPAVSNNAAVPEDLENEIVSVHARQMLALNPAMQEFYRSQVDPQTNCIAAAKVIQLARPQYHFTDTFFLVLIDAVTPGGVTMATLLNEQQFLAFFHLLHLKWVSIVNFKVCVLLFFILFYGAMRIAV